MKSVFTSSIIAIALWFSMQGVLPATYVILGILGLVCFLTVYTAVIATGMMKHILHNAEQYIEAIQEKPLKDDPRLRFLLHLIYFVATYHIFLMGYTFIAGICVICVLIIFLSNIVDVVFSGNEQE
jgi:hypothetical protein